MKIKISGYLKQTEKVVFTTTGIKTKNKIILHINNEVIILEINANEVLFKKKNFVSELNINFKPTTTAIYILNNHHFTLKIKTNQLIIKECELLINYTILDSNETFEFYLKWEE